VGCGRTAPKSELVRLVAVRDEDARRTQRAVIDAAGVLPGRGAYLCRDSPQSNTADADCLQHALRRGAVARTLRHNVKLDLGDPSVEIPNS
jgi:predicted RNA-binding protein YlxR (DUF448 family)